MEWIHRVDLGREDRQMKRTKPPKLAEKILCILSFSKKIGILGDTEEEYRMIRSEKGRFKADVWYVWQIFRPLPFFIRSNIYWSATMLKNYLIIALRNIKRNKVYSVINMLGLATGMACCILITIYIQFEFSYDRYHPNADRIYRVMINMKDPIQERTQFVGSPAGLVPVLTENFPEVVTAAAIKAESSLVKYKDIFFGERRFYYADPEIFKIFYLPLVKGDPKTALEKPYSILISQEIASRYFEKEEPLGKTLHVDNRHDFMIAGVFQDILENSHFHCDFLASISSHFQNIGRERATGWNNFGYKTYILFHEMADLSEFSRKINEYCRKFIPAETLQKIVDDLWIQPLADIHFYNQALGELETNADIRNIFLFSAISFCILLIACFNYMNLATARSAFRTREVGLRKVVGAQRRQIINQFMGESLTTALFSFGISLLLVRIFLPMFSSYINRPLSFSQLSGLSEVFILIGIIVIVGIFSGVYPALVLSSFQPVNIFRGMWSKRSKGSFYFRNSLVVLQFIASIILIICSVVTYQQLRYIRNKDLGFNRNHILIISGWGLRPSFESVKHELLQNPHVLDITHANGMHWNLGYVCFCQWQGKDEDENLITHGISVGYNFIDFYDLEIVEGRNFSREFSTDNENAYILNETAVRAIGWENPLGKKFFIDGEREKGVVVGVVKDFHFASLHLAIQPLAIDLSPFEPFNYDWISLKISPQDVSDTLSFLEQKWQVYSPDYPINYFFLDGSLDRLYRTEQRLGQIFSRFTAIAVFLACLGLFGLAMFTAEQRTKEIGIRKVLGASVPSVLMLLSREFIKWVFVANLIAWPIGYYIMHRWLQSFAYKTHIGWLVIALAAALSLGIALLTVSFQSIKSATANPVDSLRYE